MLLTMGVGSESRRSGFVWPTRVCSALRALLAPALIERARVLVVDPPTREELAPGAASVSMGGNIEEGFDILTDVLEVGLTVALLIRCALASSRDIREKADTLESVQPERALLHGDTICSRRFSVSGVSIRLGEPMRGRGEEIIFG